MPSRHFPIQLIEVNRSGFTLVELLVAMSIFVILATLTVSGFRSAYDSDRVGEAASTIRAALEGARSRAIKSDQKRGVRFLLDPVENQPGDPYPQFHRRVTSLIYLGAPEVVEGYARIEFDNGVDGTEAWSHGHWRVFSVPGDNPDSDPYFNWRNLSDRGLLRANCQIVIDGTPFRLLRASQVGAREGGNNLNDDAWVITPAVLAASPSPVPDAPEGMAGGMRPDNAEQSEIDGSAPPHGLTSAVASRKLEYRLYLAPAPLEGVAAINLPRNTMIDLVGSQIPLAWKPSVDSSDPSNPLAPDRPFGPLSNPDDPTSVVLPMDVMFTPKGYVDRDLVGEGFLHLRVADVTDITEARLVIDGYNLPPWQPSVAPNPPNSKLPIVIKDPLYPAKLVTLVTQTGVLRVSGVSGEGDTSEPLVPNNEFLAYGLGTKSPFYFAIFGREAK